MISADPESAREDNENSCGFRGSFNQFTCKYAIDHFELENFFWV
jgi:hypothetical protein